jgi:DNA end-binding protein Ku
MHFANEIRRVPEFGAVETVNLKPQEVKLAEQLIGTMMKPFTPSHYHNGFQERLRQLVQAKRRGQPVEIEEAEKRAPVIDMMEALKKSLATRNQSGGEARKLPRKRRSTRIRKAS